MSDPGNGDKRLVVHFVRGAVDLDWEVSNSRDPVRPEARGRGIAGGLTAALLKQAQELGCHRVVLHSSELAVDVYRRAGFAERCSLTVYANAPLWSSRDH